MLRILNLANFKLWQPLSASSIFGEDSGRVPGRRPVPHAEALDGPCTPSTAAQRNPRALDERKNTGNETTVRARNKLVGTDLIHYRIDSHLDISSLEAWL